MARNEFEKATTNYGNYFSNNGGNHHYTTYGHKYDDSAYVLAKLNGQVDPSSISSTKIGYPSNNVITYGQGYDVTVKDHSHIDDYTQVIKLRWPSNINTPGKIEGTLSFRINKTTVTASGGTVNIYFPNLKYTATRDTRGYRYVDVTLRPDVPSNPDDLDDDGTASSNATVQSTTYVGENRQGFLNYQEPMMDYVIYSSYGSKGDAPFILKADTKVYNATDSISDIDSNRSNNLSSTNVLTLTYMHMYDNKNIKYSYAYAPYHDEVKGNTTYSTSEGVGWTHTNIKLVVDDNFLSTYPRVLTIAYNNPTVGDYYNISYDGSYGSGTILLRAAFSYRGSYSYYITTSSLSDTNCTSYTRSTVLHNLFPGISNSSTTPSYLATSYTIRQPKATLTTSYMWTLPEGGDCTNYDTKTGKKYVGFGEWEDTWVSITGNEPILYVNKQDHYMGYVSGNLEVSLAGEATGRIINMDNGTTKEGTIGNLKWTDCENGTERFFNVRVITKYDNCRNQNITSISGEYYNNDRRMPMVTLKCRQLPANWSHPGIRFKYKCQRYLIPDDTRFNKLNPFTYIYDNYRTVGSAGEITTSKDWTISTHRHHYVSSIDTNNTKLKFDISMPVISTPYIKSTVDGSISASASTTYVGPTKSDITITPTWNVYYTQGYNKGFDAAEWKYSFVGVEGYNDHEGSYDGTGMDCSGVTGFDDFIVHLNKCDNFSYRYPEVTLTAASSNSTFSLDTTTNVAGSEDSLADGTKSTGFVVSVPANPKTGSEWAASISTTPTVSTDGYITIGSGDLNNSFNRSTRIRFSNSFNTDLTSGSITSPSPITITQGADKWGGSDNIRLCFAITGNAFVSVSNLCISQSIPRIGVGSNSKRYKLGKLKQQHQLVLTGIGSVAGSDKTCSYTNSSVTVTSSGTPTQESSSTFTYKSTVIAWCDDHNKIGVTYGPNGSTSTTVANYTVSPKAVSWKRQYKLLDDSNRNDSTAGWQDSTSVYIGANTGNTASASCIRNSNAINNGPFTFIPKKYLGSSPRTFRFKVAAYDNNSGVRYIKNVDYKITQGGTDPTYYTSFFKFSSSTTRCTVNGLQSEIKSDTPQNCGSFTVTPNTNPFTGDIAYTNGMVPGSHSNNITTGISSGSTTISKVGESKTDFDYGTTNPGKSIGVSGSSKIVYSTTGALKYKFYYSYTVTCSSGAIASGSGTSNEQTWTPSANATNYSLKMRYKSPSMTNYSSWSTTLTTTANAMGTWSVQGAFMSGNTMYGIASTFIFTFSTMGSNYDEYRCTLIKITSSTPYETYNASYSVTPTLTYTIQVRTCKGDGTVISDWKNTTYTNGVTLNETTHTFTGLGINVPKEFTFTASIASGISDATSSSTSNKTHTVKVTRKQKYSYRTYCTMTVTNATITAWDTSGTTSCTFTATMQRSKDNFATIENLGADSKVTINASSKKLTPTSMGNSESNKSDTTFTFTLSGGTYSKVGTTSATGHVYKYGKTYYND